jgi:hypothetical protein
MGRQRTRHVLGHPVGIGINNRFLRMSKDAGRKSDAKEESGAHCVEYLVGLLRRNNKNTWNCAMQVSGCN